MSTENQDPSQGISVSIRRSVLARMKTRAARAERSVSWLLNKAAEDFMERNPDPEADAEAIRGLSTPEATTSK